MNMPHDVSGSAPGTPATPEALKLSASELFRAFAWMGLCGFGGIMPWAHRILVERKRWIDERDFAEVLSLGQMLPGPNIINMAVMLGYRFNGVRGACAALAGLLGIPFVIVLMLGALYHRFGDLRAVQGALHGMTAVASGLIGVTGIKLARSQPRTVRGLLFGTAALLAAGVLQWPLLRFMLILIPLAIVIEWRQRP